MSWSLHPSLHKISPDLCLLQSLSLCFMPKSSAIHGTDTTNLKVSSSPECTGTHTMQGIPKALRWSPSVPTLYFHFLKELPISFKCSTQWMCFHYLVIATPQFERKASFCLLFEQSQWTSAFRTSRHRNPGSKKRLSLGWSIYSKVSMNSFIYN
jgi:hypothetical protein